jgi:Undecaprenyl-phosphate glucose phosphotransferase
MSVTSLRAIEDPFDFGGVSPGYRQRGRSIHPFVLILIFRIIDLTAPLLMGYAWYEVYCKSFEPSFWAICGRFSVVAAVLSALILQLVGCYRAEEIRDARGFLRPLWKGFLWLLAVGWTTAFLCKSLNDVSRVWAVLWLVSWAALVVTSRLVAGRFVRARAAAGQFGETIAVVGATAWADELCTLLRKQQGPSLRIVGVFDDRRERVAARFASSVRPLNELLELGRRVNIDRIVLALPLQAEARILELANRLMALAVDIVACPDLSDFSLLRRPVLSHAGLPSIHIIDRPIPDGQFLIKVVADKIVALTLLILLSPLLAILAVAIKLTSPGPVLFRQPRLGYNNREFQMLKFRSMRSDSTDPTGGRQAQRNDKRVTPLGKFLRRSSLDELPQLFNVLLGDMSLVGPRPLPIGMRTQDLYNHEIVERYAHRHRVRPGITGWAQVRGCRGATQFPDELRHRVELDLYYIEHWSLSFDLKILFLTGLHLVHSENAF